MQQHHTIIFGHRGASWRAGTWGNHDALGGNGFSLVDSGSSMAIN